MLFLGVISYVCVSLKPSKYEIQITFLYPDFMSDYKSPNFLNKFDASRMGAHILFNADTRYTVTRTGPVVDLPTLFDGRMMPYYTSTPISAANPVVILIEGLPDAHTQTGAWVGWTTRYWPTNRFKIEGYDYGWVTFADYSSTDYLHHH